MFRKKSASPPPPPPAATPYLSARREWDERYGHLLTQARSWRLAATAAIGVAALAVLGVTWIGAQTKIQPFVIAVDNLGSPVAVAKPGALQRGQERDERVIRAQIGNWVWNARTLLTDFTAQQVLFDRVYAMLATDAAAALKPFFEDDRMPKLREQTQVSVEIKTVLPAGGDTWQVDWVETVTRPGDTVRREKWRALITVGFSEKLAAKPELMMWNPYGMYVKQVSWQKEI